MNWPLLGCQILLSQQKKEKITAKLFMPQSKDQVVAHKSFFEEKEIPVFILDAGD